MIELIDTTTFTYIILPILIFLSRVFDVSIGTLRIILLSKGSKFLAPFLGFFEVLIWLLAARQVITNLNGWIPLLAYSFGFAAGTYAGIIIEEKLSLGKVLLRAITKKDASKLVEAFEKGNFPITSTSAKSTRGRVHVLYLIINRKRVNSATELIKKYNPDTHYSIEDVRYASEDTVELPGYKKTFSMYRKSK